MPALGKHRQPIIDAAIKHFRQQGYPGTGLSEILQSSGAPKGSLYHYFPDGKPSIAVAAVEQAADRMAATMQAVATRAKTPEGFIRGFAKKMGGWLKSSGYKDGCPMTTVLLELAPQDREVTKAGQSAYRKRLAVIEGVLRSDGFEPRYANQIACLWMSTLNGALIQARVERSVKPLETSANLLAQSLVSLKNHDE